MSGHPLERFARDLTLFGARRVAELTGSEPDIWMAGIVSGLRPLKTRKGDRMAVFMLDDVDGSVEVVVFPETFGKHGSLIDTDAMLLVRGKLEKDDESARLVATELLPIAALMERTTREVAIHLKGPAARHGPCSKRWPSCCRATAATAGSRSSSTSSIRAPTGRCASAPTSRSA